MVVVESARSLLRLGWWCGRDLLVVSHLCAHESERRKLCERGGSGRTDGPGFSLSLFRCCLLFVSASHAFVARAVCCC